MEQKDFPYNIYLVIIRYKHNLKKEKIHIAAKNDKKLLKQSNSLCKKFKAVMTTYKMVKKKETTN